MQVSKLNAGLALHVGGHVFCARHHTGVQVMHDPKRSNDDDEHCSGHHRKDKDVPARFHFTTQMEKAQELNGKLRKRQKHEKSNQERYWEGVFYGQKKGGGGKKDGEQKTQSICLERSAVNSAVKMRVMLVSVETCWVICHFVHSTLKRTQKVHDGKDKDPNKIKKMPEN